MARSAGSLKRGFRKIESWVPARRTEVPGDSARTCAFLASNAFGANAPGSNYPPSLSRPVLPEPPLPSSSRHRVSLPRVHGP